MVEKLGQRQMRGDMVEGEGGGTEGGGAEGRVTGVSCLQRCTQFQILTF
jgi:molybdenum-dependent DNA-binding transcriptional regulator ModE